MILDNTITCKNYEEIIEAKTHKTLNYKCPCCGAFNSFIKHCRYPRGVCYLDENLEPCYDTIIILRVKCKSCSSTHAILPADIIPYAFYTTSFIITILIECFVNEKKVSDVTNKFSISKMLIYYLIQIFLLFKTQIILVLRLLGFYEIENKMKPLLESINSCEEERKNKFPINYFRKIKKVFLMRKFQNIITPPVHIGMHIC